MFAESQRENGQEVKVIVSLSKAASFDKVAQDYENRVKA
jgi:hypothetical protein